MKNWLFLVFGVLFWVYGAATCLETLKKDHPCFFELDTGFWQCPPAVSRWASHIWRLPTSSTNHLHITTHYHRPSPHTSGGSTHQLQHYLLRDPPLCYESIMLEPTQSALLLAVKRSTQHSIVSQPQRTEERHGFIYFWRQLLATVSKNCLCVLTTSKLTVSLTSFSTNGLHLYFQGRSSPETFSKQWGTSNFAWNTCRWGTCKYRND